jgi:hypothetical protein
MTAVGRSPTLTTMIRMESSVDRDQGPNDDCRHSGLSKCRNQPCADDCLDKSCHNKPVEILPEADPLAEITDDLELPLACRADLGNSQYILVKLDYLVRLR